MDWFSSYLHGRQQAVRVGRCFSNWCDVATGVPQGGILPPLLFSVFINLLTRDLGCSYHLYADDLQIYAQAKVDEISCAITQLNNDLRTVCDWASRFGVTVNPLKCQAIIIGSLRQLSRLDCDAVTPILFNNTIIPYSPHVKNLGLVIDRTFSWKPHVTEVSHKIIATLRSLCRFKNFLPTSTKIILVQCLILPILDYADVCYPDLNQDLQNKLDRLLNSSIRFIFNLRKYDHISNYRSLLRWLPVRQRRHARLLSTLFSLLFDPVCPEYLRSKFQFLCSSHDLSLRSSNNLLLCVPSHRTGFLANSFTLESVRCWNALPLNIRQAPNKYSFKRLILDHLLKISQS